MPISSCPEATFIANVSHLAILSASLPSAPRAKLDGATTKSTPAIRRMSPRPKHLPRCCRRSQPDARRNLDSQDLLVADSSVGQGSAPGQPRSPRPYPKGLLARQLIHHVPDSAARIDRCVP